MCLPSHSLSFHSSLTVSISSVSISHDSLLPLFKVTSGDLFILIFEITFVACVCIRNVLRRKQGNTETESKDQPMIFSIVGYRAEVFSIICIFSFKKESQL
mmetsp:Transcript_36090/g.26808  ORF Transcript_36090/g.26808 Transcript_36090/m.26808 type:complete len:101 (-) Transcript_36090:96-398(-)